MLPTYPILLHAYKILNVFRLQFIFSCVCMYVSGVRRLRKGSIKLEEKANHQETKGQALEVIHSTATILPAF